MIYISFNKNKKIAFLAAFCFQMFNIETLIDVQRKSKKKLEDEVEAKDEDEDGEVLEEGRRKKGEKRASKEERRGKEKMKNLLGVIFSVSFSSFLFMFYKIKSHTTMTSQSRRSPGKWNDSL